MYYCAKCQKFTVPNHDCIDLEDTVKEQHMCTCSTATEDCPTCSEPMTAPPGGSCVYPELHGHGDDCAVLADETAAA